MPYINSITYILLFVGDNTVRCDSEGSWACRSDSNHMSWWLSTPIIRITARPGCGPC